MKDDGDEGQYHSRYPHDLTQPASKLVAGPSTAAGRKTKQGGDEAETTAKKNILSLFLATDVSSPSPSTSRPLSLVSSYAMMVSAVYLGTMMRWLSPDVLASSAGEVVMGHCIKGLNILLGNEG